MDSRNRVWRLFLVIAERIECMSRAGVPPTQVPQNKCYPCGESEHTKDSAKDNSSLVRSGAANRISVFSWATFATASTGARRLASF
jgi:hypothetical protein